MYYDNTHIKNFKIDGHGIFTGSLNFNVTDEIGDLCPLHLDWPLHCIQIIYALCFTVSVSLKNVSSKVHDEHLPFLWPWENFQKGSHGQKFFFFSKI